MRERLIDMGCRFIPIEMESKGINPIADAALLSRYISILKS